MSLIGDRGAGCIALDNAEMREVWSRVTLGAEVLIR